MRLTVSFLILISLFFGSLATAADQIDLRGSKDLLQKIHNNNLMRIGAQAALRDVLGFDENTTLQLIAGRTDRSGLNHSRYRILFKGVPVWGRHIVISENGQRVMRLHGTAVTGMAQDLSSVEPAFDAARAMEIVKNKKSRGSQRRLYKNESSELVVFIHNDKAILSYAVSYFADIERGGQPTRPMVLLDAKTGKILHQYEGLTTEEKDGTGPGGNAKTGKYVYGVDFPSFQVSFDGSTSTMDTKNVRTVNLDHWSIPWWMPDNPHKYSGTENTHKSINGAHCPINDAHYFGKMVFGLYSEWYNTAPINVQLKLNVHYSNDFENAFWNGSSMTFGDGADRFYPLVSLDVVSHEVSHGFTEQNSGLIYEEQSGGLNEAFSDMAGEAAEYYMHGKNDWLIGAQIFKKEGALRYMDDPTKDGSSIGSAKDFQAGMDVHHSSGVFNKAFYLLANTNGWTTRKAFDIFVKANRDYWTPDSNYQSGAQGAVDAAKDLGYSTADVVAAFQAVDVIVTAD